jgi:hypothetical protein
MKRQRNSKKKLLLDRKQKFKKFFIELFDGFLRGILAFLIFGLLGYGLLSLFPSLPRWYILPFIIILSVLTGKYFSKIKYGEKLFTFYEQWLFKTFKI